MTNILEAFGTDPQLEESGVWVDFAKNMSFKICAFGNKKHNQVLERLRRPYEDQIRRKTIEEGKEEEIHVRALSEAVLIDWKGDGIVDPDNPKKVLPYSKENAIKLLSDERLKRLKGQILNVSSEQQTFKINFEEESVKNSKKSSNGS